MILGLVRKGGVCHAPTWRVQCPVCATVYLLTAWPKQAKAGKPCQSCTQRARLAARPVVSSPP